MEFLSWDAGKGHCKGSNGDGCFRRNSLHNGGGDVWDSRDRDLDDLVGRLKIYVDLDIIPFSVTLLVLWSLFFRYFRIFPGTARKCNISLSIKIHILEIQQTMLSMDTSVEKYLEMGALGLLVLTRQLQDPSYRTMRHILILKYWARKAKYHNISHLADCWHFRVTHIKHHTF